MRSLVALVPSYDRPEKLERTLQIVAKTVQTDDVLVLEQPRGCPLGSAEARRILCEQAVAKHGPSAVLLMLDDDVTAIQGDVRRAAMLLERPGVGLVQLVNRSGHLADKEQHRPVLYHAFLIDGRMIAEGLNYESDEYADEVDLSLRAYFRGYRGLRTQRARVLHHVTSRGQVVRGGIEAAYAEGAVPIRCRNLPRMRELGWITYDVGYRDGVELPTPYASIRVTPLGREVHNAVRRERGW